MASDSPQFPRIQSSRQECWITSSDPRHQSCCNDSVPFLSAEAANCQPVDVDGIIVLGGSRGAICYACRCRAEALHKLPHSEVCQKYHMEANGFLIRKLIAALIVVVINQALKTVCEKIVVRSLNRALLNRCPVHEYDSKRLALIVLTYRGWAECKNVFSSMLLPHVLHAAEI